jgi:hypothetical protein
VALAKAGADVLVVDRLTGRLLGKGGRMRRASAVVERAA